MRMGSTKHFFVRFLDSNVAKIIPCLTRNHVITIDMFWMVKRKLVYFYSIYWVQDD